MTDATALGGLTPTGISAPSGISGQTYIQSRARAALPGLLWLWAFSGGFVLVEPSPYEVTFLLVLGAALIAGTGLWRGTFPLFGMLLAFIPSALIAVFMPRHFDIVDSLLYTIVTIYLWITAYVVANLVADAPREMMRALMRGYMAVALVAAIIGTLAYLGLMPGKELFLRFGRAKATFEDPNVFGPFLILPAMYALQKLLLLRGRPMVWGTACYLILFVGIFVSFSRGAWGHFFLSTMIVYGAVFVLEAKARDKVRMLILAMLGMVLLVAVLAALLSIDSVRDLFLERFSLNQTYDTGSTGRFGRQAYALELAIANPFGLGPYEFTALRIIEDPHNTFVKVLLTYGWIGGFAYIAMVFATLWRGLTHVVRAGANRLLLIPLVAVYMPLVLQSATIDNDHWRHFYLVTGLIWGITTAYNRQDKNRNEYRGALI